MAAEIMNTVLEFTQRAKNRMSFLKKANPLTLVPAERPPDSLTIEILGPNRKSRKSFLFILFIAERLKKVTQIVPIFDITAYGVMVPF